MSRYERNEDKERLLTDWDNRPSLFFTGSDSKRLGNEIELLEKLQKGGCANTRDGLSVAMQLDVCRAVLGGITQAQCRE
jgi:hypothetical protein